MLRFSILLFLILFCFGATAQEWWFWPDYTLGQRAYNYPGNRLPYPVSRSSAISPASLPLTFMGEDPTERIENLVEPEKLPGQHFSVEFWILNHVNQPVGALATVKSRLTNREPEWVVGMHNKTILFSLKTNNRAYASIIKHELKGRGWKNYWYHVVANYSGGQMQLFVNGELVGEVNTGDRNEAVDDANLELASYMAKEPYMKLGNLVKMFALHDRSLSPKEITQRFDGLRAMVTDGRLYRDLFHFNAGPYLHYATRNSINITWETDRPADFIVEYGKQLPLDKQVEVSSLNAVKEPGSESPRLIQEITLSNLDPATAYFYNIKARARDGSTMESGILTFATAVEELDPFAFAVIGDTEARPHINDRICDHVWDERPNLFLVVGDLTDGGKSENKFEWNFEYFQGVTQLASRVPVFPVAGNGEGDLVWYNRYHRLPEREAYYSFTYGNAEFFMLNSNQSSEFAPGGAQYQWLEEKLRNSKARWKFVAHHHAPYSADEDDYGDSWRGATNMGDLAIRQIVPLYEKYDVDMVFFGHLHTYQRTLPIANSGVDKKNGVIYVQGGGGGGNLEDFAPSRAWFSAKTYRGHHYFIVSVHDNSLNLKMYDSEGRLRDYLDLAK
ncbi:MAG: metallophosphoesterase [Cyclobacteriaceae bacterium]|jgi:hypothetical protein